MGPLSKAGGTKKLPPTSPQTLFSSSRGSHKLSRVIMLPGKVLSERRVWSRPDWRGLPYSLISAQGAGEAPDPETRGSWESQMEAEFSATKICVLGDIFLGTLKILGF